MNHLHPIKKEKIEKIKTERVGPGMTYPEGWQLAISKKSSGPMHGCDWVLVEKINEIIDKLNTL